jgi:hypothetical protein
MATEMFLLFVCFGIENQHSRPMHSAAIFISKNDLKLCLFSSKLILADFYASNQCIYIKACTILSIQDLKAQV